MNVRKILVPVFGSVDAADIARDSFWLARNMPGELHLIEVIPPPGFVQWLLAPIRNLLKKPGDQRLQQAQHSAIWQEHLCCEIGQMRAPSLMIGIVEAARRVKPDILILAPELHEHMGPARLYELRQRLGEIGRCTLILLARGSLKSASNW